MFICVFKYANNSAIVKTCLYIHHIHISNYPLSADAATSTLVIGIGQDFHIGTSLLENPQNFAHLKRILEYDVGLDVCKMAPLPPTKFQLKHVHG